MQRIKTNNAISTSIITILLCVALLIGSTYAWFTDESATATNSIVAGTLDIALEQYDATAGAWVSAEGKTLEFIDMDDNHLWEPGATYALPKLRIANNSQLAIDYEIVIDGIYEKDGLNEVIEWTVDGELTGAMLPDEKISDEIQISAHMMESAGNEFQGMTLNGISVTVYATQKAEEYDSFGNEYDIDAKYVEVDTFDELQEVLSNGGHAKLTADIDAATVTPKNKRLNVPVGKNATIDLNGHTLTSKDGGNENWMAIFVDQHAHLTINDRVGTGKIVSSCYGIYVKQNAKLTMNGGTLDVHGNGAYDMGVVLYNGEFAMNGGSIDALIGVCASNYYKNSDDTLPVNKVTIGSGATINATYMDIDLSVGYADEASDTIVVDNRA